MNRYTARYDNGQAYFKAPNYDCTEEANALAAYEDTGLTPADIADLKNEHCLMCGKYKTAHLGSCDGCRWKKGELTMTHDICERYFIDDCGQGFTAPCCKDEDGRDYTTFVTCKGDKSKCCK